MTDVKTVDSAVEIIKEGESFEWDLDKIVVKSGPKEEITNALKKIKDKFIDISLTHWEKRGIRIDFMFQGFRLDDSRDKPYTTKEEALETYDRVLTELRKGNYSIEVYEGANWKIVIPCINDQL